MKENLREQWNETCLSLGIPSLTADTCARIMAVLLIHGNNEMFTHNTHFMADVKYIQKRFHLCGAGIVPADFATLLREHVQELLEYEEHHKNVADAKPEWAVKLFKGMYNIDI